MYCSFNRLQSYKCFATVHQAFNGLSPIFDKLHSDCIFIKKELLVIRMSQKFLEHCICKFIAFISQGFSVKSFYFRSIPCCCVKKTAIVQIKTKTRDIIESDDDDVI